MEADDRRRLSAAMARLRDGDRSAFPAVYASVRPAILALARRLVAAEAVDDAAQLALIDVFENAHQYDPSRDALSWVLGITAYKCRTIEKKRQRRRWSDPPEHEPACDEPDPAAVAERADLLRAAKVILGEMSSHDAEAILASAGLVERPDVGGATYRKRLERALVRFKRMWGARHGA
ncbi:MAG: sigma factor [Deltaproteobacteria bacterium]|jgi:DNA-directed RNA polymerase specialized sigma24 family protein